MTAPRPGLLCRFLDWLPSCLASALAAGLALASLSGATAATPRCLTDCTPRIGIVSAFGEEAKILVAETTGRRQHLVNGNRFTTGTLRGQRVVIVLSGVSMINSTMVTQLMLDHFRIDRLVMSGIAGGLNPDHRIGDVTVPDRWAMPMEVYWHHDNTVPSPCGGDADVACLGLRLARRDGRPFPPLELPAPSGMAVPSGMFVRENFVMSRATAPAGEFRFDYPVDRAMLEVVRTLTPVLALCGPKATAKAPNAAPDPAMCVRSQPRLLIGGRGVSGTAFVANPHYRRWLHEALQAETVEMETAALAHVAHANAVPYIAFRSISDLAGGEAFDADAHALFVSGLAETNEAAVTLAFLEAWGQARPRAATRARAEGRP